MQDPLPPWTNVTLRFDATLTGKDLKELCETFGLGDGALLKLLTEVGKRHVENIRDSLNSYEPVKTVTQKALEISISMDCAEDAYRVKASMRLGFIFRPDSTPPFEFADFD